MTTTLGLSPTLAALDHLAHQAAEHGVDVDRALVVQVVRAATRSGAPSVLGDVVTDPREPAVARERALGALLTHLVHHSSDPTTPQAQPRSAWPVHAA
jgi:hypothetical protein